MSATTIAPSAPSGAGDDTTTIVTGKPRERRRPRGAISRFVQPVSAIVIALLLLGIPFWIVVVTASKTQAEALRPDMSLPTEFALFDNFATAFTDGSMLVAFGGSLLVMVPSVLGVLILGSMAAWILGRRSSRLLAFLYALGISGIVLPPAVVTIVLLLRQLGLAGTAVGMIGVYMGMYLSTVIFFVTGFVRTIPPELEEAARVDGASPLRVYVKIILPLLMPVLATATILICLYIWNDVFYALFVIGGRVDTLPLNLYQIASSGLYLQNWHLIFAYIILMSLPLLITFIVAQRKIISGITSGAVK
ncbi:carbohydrate ABC transporter permease [Microbacterium sp. cx-55]|uniref:carbohydrate ABC transporter permease n=1 Tax=unclassified Microbacterium TaxID=2609290 RepID=UPI001CBFC82C|nr:MULTISPECIES: carbohydrate ABC transporter permease [unclassified Microbacterium]MCC4908062.1 carbohydrate ABC transporter permease [Microbacterium sp. cx-59]UGB35795.1 carbohydrate ABC transporter permease [Microbacterium sp. cx-55]